MRRPGPTLRTAAFAVAFVAAAAVLPGFDMVRDPSIADVPAFLLALAVAAALYWLIRP